MPFIDFEALKASTTIEQTAKLLGLELKQAGQSLRGKCPACNTDDPRSLVITPAKGAFYCFAEKKGGDLIALAAHIRGESVKEAASFLAGNSTVTARVPVNSSDPKPAPKVPERGFDRAKYRAGLERTHELLKDIPADLIERADIGVSSRGALKGIVLPLYAHATGEFICYAAVTGLQLPKATVVPLKKAG